MRFYPILILLICLSFGVESYSQNKLNITYSVAGQTKVINDETHDYFLRLDGPILEVYAEEKGKPLTRANRVLSVDSWSNGSRSPIIVGDFITSFRGNSASSNPAATIIGIPYGYCPDYNFDQNIHQVSITEFKLSGTNQDIMSFISPNPNIPAVSNLSLSFNIYCNSIDNAPIASGSISFNPSCLSTTCILENEVARLSALTGHLESLLDAEKINNDELQYRFNNVALAMDEYKRLSEDLALQLKNLTSLSLVAKDSAKLARSYLSTASRYCKNTNCTRAINKALLALKNI